MMIQKGVFQSNHHNLTTSQNPESLYDSGVLARKTARHYAEQRSDAASSFVEHSLARFLRGSGQSQELAFVAQELHTMACLPNKGKPLFVTPLSAIRNNDNCLPHIVN